MPHSTYLPERMGSASIEPTGAFEAGSFQSFTLTYTAGYFGIDDTGSIKIVHRFASDMGRPQFDNPTAPNYVTAEASNNAVLDMRYDGKQNIRPWDKTLYIKVVRGFLRVGDLDRKYDAGRIAIGALNVESPIHFDDIRVEGDGVRQFAPDLRAVAAADRLTLAWASLKSVR